MLGGSKFLLEFLFCSSEFKPLFICKTKNQKVQQKNDKKNIQPKISLHSDRGE